MIHRWRFVRMAEPQIGHTSPGDSPDHVFLQPWQRCSQRHIMAIPDVRTLIGSPPREEATFCSAKSSETRGRSSSIDRASTAISTSDKRGRSPVAVAARRAIPLASAPGLQTIRPRVSVCRSNNVPRSGSSRATSERQPGGVLHPRSASKGQASKAAVSSTLPPMRMAHNPPLQRRWPRKAMADSREVQAW